jgi:hypothetical protein
LRFDEFISGAKQVRLPVRHSDDARLPPAAELHEGSIAATHTRQLMCEFRYFYK